MGTKYSAEKADTTLRKLGVGHQYLGYQIVLCSLEYISKDSARLCALMKEVCIPVSEKMGCNPATVETSIRRVSERCWRNNPELLQSISPCPLTKRPAVQAFLEMLYYTCCE